MKYRVEITDTAWAELQAAYEWLTERAPGAARRWRDSLLQAVAKLESHPGRYPLAPESDYLGGNVRQLLYGKRRGVYRVLYRVDADCVYVLRVRHGARRFLGET